MFRQNEAEKISNSFFKSTLVELRFITVVQPHMERFKQ